MFTRFDEDKKHDLHPPSVSPTGPRGKIKATKAFKGMVNRTRQQFCIFGFGNWGWGLLPQITTKPHAKHFRKRGNHFEPGAGQTGQA
eukprot:2006627-Amphidinium_carterae.1